MMMSLGITGTSSLTRLRMLVFVVFVWLSNGLPVTSVRVVPSMRPYETVFPD